MSMTNTPRATTVVGVFHDRERARQAIEALKEDGFSGESISILSPDKHATQEIAEDTGTHAGAGAATGAVTGGLLGGLGGWLVGIGALAIPGIGPFIAAGAFASALGGAAIGAGIGAIAGALMGMGVPEEHAKYYEGEARSGKTLVTVRHEGRYEDAQRVLRQHGAYDVDSRDGGVAPAAVGATSETQEPRPGRDLLRERETVQLREEELVANKQSVQTGEVQLGKEVVSEERTLNVPVTREEVTITRTPVDRRQSDRAMDERTETISVPVHEEQVEVHKQAHVYEEVGVRKRAVEETEEVSGTVRREAARIERDGNANVEDKKFGS
ncbi:MAG TPA: YsnF/AvaK domain-containing protein [Chloroflexota bacterium]|nr:YsnF/AvaK domain-containing protein [Chloroflexota bacterium]